MMIELERYQDYKDNQIYVTYNGTWVVGVPVEYNRYDKDAWQDAHKELALGIYCICHCVRKTREKIIELIGHAPSKSTILKWLHAKGIGTTPPYHSTLVYEYLDLVGAPTPDEYKRVAFKLGVPFGAFEKALARWRKKHAKAMCSPKLR